jgi:hypothetical protein
MSLKTRLSHWWLALITLPHILLQPEQRRLLVAMRRFSRQLPQTMQQPIAKAMVQITPNGLTGTADPRVRGDHTIRQLADLAALLDRRSPLGICLRRSLVRYHFLRQAGVPLTVVFGARFDNGRQANSQISGHAWTTLDNSPYYEADENWRNFTVMFTWPEAGNR